MEWRHLANAYAINDHSLHGSAELFVRVVRISMELFGGATAKKPLNQLTQNLASVITSGTPLNTPSGMSIGLGGLPPRRGEMLMVVCSLAQLGVKPWGSNRWTDFDE